MNREQVLDAARHQVERFLRLPGVLLLAIVALIYIGLFAFAFLVGIA